jgi:hypothetical protein
MKVVVREDWNPRPSESVPVPEIPRRRGGAAVDAER